MMLKSMSFPLTVPNRTSKDGLGFFFYSHLSFIAAYSEAASLTVFTTMCPKEQQTSDNMIVKDNYFIVEIFDKCSFSGILRGCLSHLNEA